MLVRLVIVINDIEYAKSQTICASLGRQQPTVQQHEGSSVSWIQLVGFLQLVGFFS